MKRVIKFRAWDTTTNKMITNDVESLYDEGYWDGVCCSNFTMLHSVLETKDIIWLQFTGLTDNNGKEIYEGDILQRYKKSGEPYKKTKTVEYLHAGFVNLEHALESRVIGNIYENPELLESK